MRIDWLITELNTLGGAESYVRQMAPRLQQLGHSIRVITFMSGGILIDELRSAGVQTIELGLHNRMDWKALIRLRQIWKTGRPDLVHTHLYHAGIVGRIAAHMMGIRLVVVHQHGAEGTRSYWRTLADRILSPLVSQYVTTCQAVASILRQREGISPTKISVIYNGIDCPDPTTTITKNIPDDQLSKPLTIISVGRLVPEKGHITLIEALANMKMNPKQIRLILLGDGELRTELVERSIQLGIDGLVNILGTRRDIQQQLSNADIFILPSDWEGISMALLEGMAAGLPVVATAVGGTPEVVVENATGILIPPRDPMALAQALSKLINDPGLRMRMGTAGRIRAYHKFNIRNTVQQTQALYDKLYHHEQPQ